MRLAAERGHAPQPGPDQADGAVTYHDHAVLPGDLRRPGGEPAGAEDLGSDEQAERRFITRPTT